MEKVSFDNTQIPLHYQIADYIIDMLKRGEIDPADKLLPEEKLKEIFSVSRTTIRRSLDHLQKKGLLIRKQGKGTFWTEAAYRYRKEKLSGINRQIFNVTEKTVVKVISKKVELPDENVAAFLRIKGNDPIMVFRRVRFSNSEAMSYTVNYMPKAFGELIDKRDLKEMTMLESIETKVQIKPGRIQHEVEITRASAEISRYLNISILDPVLTINTSVFDLKTNPIEIVWTYFVENRYKFKVVLD